MTMRDTLAKLAPVVGAERVARLWRAYLAGDASDRREIETAVEAYAARILNDCPDSSPPGLFPPPPRETSAGEMPLGQVRYANRDLQAFGLRKPEMLRHVGVYGSSGCGKSNGIALILDGVARQGVPFLLIDWKRTFRALLTTMPDITIFTVGDEKTAPFRFNPLVPPPGTSVEVWSKKVIGALSHAYCQGAGSESLLAEALRKAYAEARIQERWPTFADVSALLEAEPARGRKGMWLDSARRAASSLSTGNQARVFCSSKSVNVESILRKNVVLELDLLSQAEQTFLSETLLLWVVQYRMNEDAPREILKHVFIIEEAHHLLRSTPGVGDGSEPVIHIVLREIRELGESVVLATQNASVVPTAVFGNQATTIAMHTKHASDVRATAQAMLLKDDAKDELGRLPVGEAIVRVPRWPNPIHVRLNYRPIAKGTVSDARIREHMARRAYSMSSSEFRPAENDPGLLCGIPRSDDKDTYSVESPSTQAATKRVVTASPTTTPKEENGRKGIPEPTELELAMLKDIVHHPFDGVVKRIQRLRTSRRKGTAALKALEIRGSIKPDNVSTGKALIKLYDLTKNGRALCHQHNLGALPDITEGGITHRYWTHHTAHALERTGWKTRRERQIDDSLTVDVLAEKNGRSLAVLIETGKSNVERNLHSAFKSGVQSVYVIAARPEVRQSIERRLSKASHISNAYRVLSTQEFLNRTGKLEPMN